MTEHLLSRIDRPQDLHGLTDEQLQQVAQEVREHIIDTVGEIGGHFGANLGSCEIAVALHSVLDSPKDKILWDVGHQAYPHKVLTGRRDQLATIRKYGGLAPFCSRDESEHDIMGAGHASTAIGYAVGIKEAMRRGHAPDGHVVAVAGDGALTGGVAFEAVHQAGGEGTPIVVVLNDNGMSIAPNVGAMSRYFNRVRLNPKLWHAREGVEGGLTKLPAGIGNTFERLGPHFKESIKAFWAPGLWWEELDFAYMGVINGHDVRALRRALREALAAERPVVVHCATVKGKGFAPAEEGGLEGMEKWHAAKPKSIANGAPAPAPARAPGGASAAKPAPPAYTQVFGEALVAEAQRDDRVIGITAAMNSGTGLNILQRELPDRYFDVGIAEQQAILLAAGLALEGCKPVAAIYSTFLQRAYDQIVHDVCLQKLNVVFAMDRAGLVGDDGPTHHGAFDIAYLRCLPNIVLMAPRDEAMLVHMLHTALRHDDGPIALRYPRGNGVGVPLPRRPEELEIGTGEILREAENRTHPPLASRSWATAPGSARPWRPPTSSPNTASRSPSPTRASPSPSTPGSPPSSPPSTTCSSPSRRASWPAASAPRCGRPCRTPAWRRAFCAWGCPIATSPTARPSSCTRRWASPASGSPSASRPRWPSTPTWLEPLAVGRGASARAPAIVNGGPNKGGARGGPHRDCDI